MKTRGLLVASLLVSAVACDSTPEPNTSTSGGGKNEPITISCKGQPSVGNAAPTMSINSLNGAGAASVASGKVTIIDFWATWCEPCKKSFPKYQELYTKYKTSGLEILAVSVDDESGGVPDFAKNYGAKFPVGWDKGHKAADCFKPENMPSAYVVDKKGVVRFVHKGYHPGEEGELEKEVKGLL
jgi:thiol-disulfide isomerase/thioredoxin